VAAQDPQVGFHIAGEGEDRDTLERQVRDLGLAGRVDLCGAVRDIPGFLASLDVAVLPSWSEAMSNALLEYMAAARPIVATAVGAAPQLIEPGKHGLLVPPGDAGLLAAAIRVLLEAPRQAATMAAAARRRVRQRYSRQRMVERFERFFGDLVFGGQEH